MVTIPGGPVANARATDAAPSDGAPAGAQQGDSRSAATRRKLLGGAIETLRSRGITGTSARAIAAASGVNQALIFYHFGSVEDLVDVACREATAERVAQYRPQFAAVGSLRALLEIGRGIRETERGAGNVIALAQVLAGAQQDERLAATARDTLAMWIAEIEAALTRLIVNTPIADIADPAGLAQGVAAAFVGIVLYEGVNPAGASAALDTLEQLAVLAEVIDDLGPVARRALRARVRRTARAADPPAGDG
jgi:AcrR family transcriptional regulator